MPAWVTCASRPPRCTPTRPRPSCFPFPTTHSPAAAILVASSSPLDQFIVNHPEYFFGQPAESGLVNPNNLAILADHLRCAAFELPFERAAPEFGGAAAAGEILDYLESESVLHTSGGRYHWMAEHFPAECRVTQPAGGFVLWVELPPEVDSVRLFEAARAHGIAIAPGTMFTHTGRYRNFIRLNCGHPMTAKLELAVARLGELVRQQGATV